MVFFDLKKKALTTFEAAEISDVTHVTIQNWIKKGWIKAYRTAGGHRRIETEHLSEFLNSKKIPINSNVNDGLFKVLIIENRYVKILEDISGFFKCILTIPFFF